MARLLSALVLLSVATFADNTTNFNTTQSDGCSTIESKYGSETIKTASVVCAMRMSIAHCGMEVETENGKYALAYNSQTIPGPVNTKGMVWCQKGGMPMKDSKANGGCKGCGGWQIAGSSHQDTKSGLKKNLGSFMKEVKKFGDDRPYYNIAACETKGSTVANCQLTASKLYKSLTGSKASACSACDRNCF